MIRSSQTAYIDLAGGESHKVNYDPSASRVLEKKSSKLKTSNTNTLVSYTSYFDQNKLTFCK